MSELTRYAATLVLISGADDFLYCQWRAGDRPALMFEGEVVKVTAVKLRLGVLASHSGSNLQAIVDACKEGRLCAEVQVVISNNSDAYALERARNEGIPTLHLSRSTHPKNGQLDATILEALTTHDVNLVVLAGYMRPLECLVLSRYANRVLNSHPALLPRYGGKGMYGRLVHEAVLAAKEKVTGITIHVANDEYDSGPIVAQCEVPVLDDDTVKSLEARILQREHSFWVETLQKIALGEIELVLDSQSQGM